jgi:hypothetical protein
MLKLMAIAAAAMAMTGAAPAPAPPAGGHPIVIGQGYDLPSKTLGQTRRINVYLPRGYADAKRSFPVVYLLDGGEPEDFHHITGLADLAGLDGQIGEFIVVGIADIDRQHELTALSSDPEDMKLVPTAGGSDDFRRFIGAELQPWVKTHYRTSGERVVMGESLAGLFVLETFLRQPGLFDDYVSVSPSVWWDRGALAKASPALIAAWKTPPRKLWLTIGDEGSTMQAGVDDVVAALKARPPQGLVWHYESMASETHATIFHPAALKAVRWLFPAPAPAGH